MSVYTGLNVVTLVMCIITLAMATAALMPQIKLGLLILRDGLLWATLLGIVGFVGFVGWSKFIETRQGNPAGATGTVFEIQSPNVRDTQVSNEPDSVLSHSFGAQQPQNSTIQRSGNLVPVNRHDTTWQ